MRGVLREFLPVLLREVVSQRTPVREQPQGACGSQPGHPGVVSRLPERRVGFDGHALRLVDGDVPGRRLAAVAIRISLPMRSGSKTAHSTA